tara:strand:+ start:3105 stop:3272 length:168 start_codon:yes stop_codon:yes gene_type:complete
MDIEFEKDGVIKTTHEKFTDDLLAVGWKVVAEKPKPKKKACSKKKKCRLSKKKAK